jgi:hypothetical protein
VEDKETEPGDKEACPGSPRDEMAPEGLLLTLPKDSRLCLHIVFLSLLRTPERNREFSLLRTVEAF